MQDIHEYLKIAVALLVIINPLGNSPIFLSVTQDQTPAQRNQTARRSAATVAVILVLASLLGNMVLDIFGIDVASFKVGAGILVLLMAISMLHARVSGTKHTQEEADEAQDKANVAVVPLGIPLLAGPGAISSVIVYANASPSWINRVVIALISVGVAVVIWIVLVLSTRIGEMIGTTGINIGTRLMGLILSAVAVEFISQGLMALFPLLAAVR